MSDQNQSQEHQQQGGMNGSPQPPLNNGYPAPQAQQPPGHSIPRQVGGNYGPVSNVHASQQQGINYNSTPGYARAPMPNQQFNPNAAPFKPRFGGYGGQAQSAAQVQEPPELPSNLVSTLHSAPSRYTAYQQHQQPMSKVYSNGPAGGQQGMHYFNQPAAYQAASMNGPPPHMQMTGGYNVGMGGDPQRGMEALGIGAAQPQQPYSLSQELLEKVQQSPNGVALVEIQIGLEQIISEGHEFETWAGAIRSKLISSDFGEDDLALTAALIVEMAILVGGCQYNFSRLCQYLDQTIGDFALHYLIPQLQQLSNFYTKDEHQNFALFLAELYDKLSAGTTGARQEMATLLGRQLYNMLKLEMDDQLLKAVVRVLKLAGRYLEKDRGKENLDHMFAELNSLCSREDGKLSESAKGQVLSLNQLRHNSWGVTKTEQSGAPHPATSSSSSVLIVDPDGNQLTEEELAFIEEQTGKLRGGQSPAGGSWNELDDEVAEEYEKFLQDTAVRAAEKALERVSFDDDEDAGSGGNKKA